MKTFTLRRVAQTDLSTSGELVDDQGQLICKMLERGPRNPDHPRIPAGTYEISLRSVGSSKFDLAYMQLLGSQYHGIPLLLAVPGRENIEMHTANTFEELEGCLATETTMATDGSGEYVGQQSKKAYKVAYPMIAQAALHGGVQIRIVDISDSVS